MSTSRLSPDSPSLERLRNEAYSLRLGNGYLVVDDVPYLKQDGTVDRTSIVMSADIGPHGPDSPASHVVFVTGHQPHDERGEALGGVTSHRKTFAQDVPEVLWQVSRKPPSGHYDTFYDKVVTLVRVLSNCAQRVQPEAVPQTGRAFTLLPEESVFLYSDTYSTRAGILLHSQKLSRLRVAIVGLGGTGSFVLDFISKTHLREIHLYDADVFSTHNAFRRPGPTPVDVFDPTAGGFERPMKVKILADEAATMRRGVVAHPVRVDATNAADLAEFDFVFICMDASEDKRALVEVLMGANVPFSDTGLGLTASDTGLRGQVRATTYRPGSTFDYEGALSYEREHDDVYSSNVQVAELNALAAVMAVVKFKQMFGLFDDDRGALHSVYSVGSGDIALSPDLDQEDDE